MQEAGKGDLLFRSLKSPKADATWPSPTSPAPVPRVLDTSGHSDRTTQEDGRSSVLDELLPTSLGNLLGVTGCPGLEISREPVFWGGPVPDVSPFPALRHGGKLFSTHGGMGRPYAEAGTSLPDTPQALASARGNFTFCLWSRPFQPASVPLEPTWTMEMDTAIGKQRPRRAQEQPDCQTSQKEAEEKQILRGGGSEGSNLPGCGSSGSRVSSPLNGWDAPGPY
ncbi:unnamed protein product [Rangifer tarandus platyrhynchus]|uniref:Uncharacterized protein n=1 Tax=Rangifer tarandus platyrhynchus TaxID=3082113 RepID=A0ABN8YS70_RANTA|nr:unnamed protein product [Rangifer tarandus platyrhynchus]